MVTSLPIMQLADLQTSSLGNLKQDRDNRYLVIGLGSRARMFVDALAGIHREGNHLVGFCDISATRMRYAAKQLTEQFGTPEVPHFHADDLELAITTTNATHVIICSPDSTHAEYAVRAMRLGCDVICEKPIATTHEGCAAVLETARKTGRQFRLTFNYRWSPGVSQVRELIARGAIGRVRTVHFEYKLDLRHGADYFRRWHSDKALSG